MHECPDDVQSLVLPGREVGDGAGRERGRGGMRLDRIWPREVEQGRDRAGAGVGGARRGGADEARGRSSPDCRLRQSARDGSSQSRCEPLPRSRQGSTITDFKRSVHDGPRNSTGC